LASLLGVGGIAEKIKEIIEKIRAPINKLISAVVGPILRGAKKLYDKGAKFVKGVVDKGKALGKKALDKVKGKLGFGNSPEDQEKRLQKGVSAGKSAVEKLSGRKVTAALIKPVLGAVRLRYQLAVLQPVVQGKFWAVQGEIQRMTVVTEVPTVKELDKATRTALQRNRDTVRRLLNNDIPTLWKKKSIATKLAADAPLKARLETQKTDLENEYKGHEPSFEALMAGNETTADPTVLVSNYGNMLPKGQRLRDELLDLSKSDAEKEKEADQVRTQIASHLKRAVDVLGDAAVQKLLALSSFAGLKTDIDGRKVQVEKLIKDDAGKTKQLVELRADLVAADQLRQSADRAARNARFPDNLEQPIAQIDSICLNTTAAGREDASEGDGSSEAAAISEVANGKRIKGKMHGPKCRTEAMGLEGALTKLRELRTLAPDSSFLPQIDAAIKKGDERKKGLDRGVAAWQGRVTSHPNVWNQDGSSRSTEDPGWGAGL
jgi:hypothetical protein